MKEIYNGETVALGGVNLVTKQVVVDDSTGEQAKFTYDKTTGSITVLDEIDPDSVNPVTARAVATAVAGASGEVPVIGDNDNGKVLKAVVNGSEKSAEWGDAGSGLPASTQADEGKVLTVDNSGNPGWATAQGGGADIPVPTQADEGKQLMAMWYRGSIVPKWEPNSRVQYLLGTESADQIIGYAAIEYGRSVVFRFHATDSTLHQEEYRLFYLAHYTRPNTGDSSVLLVSLMAPYSDEYSTITPIIGAYKVVGSTWTRMPDKTLRTS